MNFEISFSEICQQWKKEKQKQVKRTSMAAYEVSVNRYLKQWFSSISDINDENVQAFIETKIKDGLSVKSIKDILVVLKMIARFSESKGCELNWNYKISVPGKPSPHEVAVLSIDQQKKLMEYLWKNLSFKNLGILLCMSTGLRIGEICGLKWEDIDFETSALSVNKTVYRIYNADDDTHKTELLIIPPKTIHSTRSIPIPAPLQMIMQSIGDNINKEYYIISNSTVPLEPRTYRYYFKTILKLLELPYIKFHCLRHSFATRCIESSCDYKTVSAILGHANITTTLNLYVHPSTEQKRKCIENMLASLSAANFMKIQ